MLITITVEVEKDEGQRQHREDIITSIQGELDDMAFQVEDSTYRIVSVSEHDCPKPKAKAGK